MELALRPHRGGIVLALGILSLPAALAFVPMGIVAWILGSKDLRAMGRGEVDPAGRVLTQVGWVCGVVGSILWLVMAACAALLMTATIAGPSESSGWRSSEDGVRTSEVRYPPPPDESGPGPIKEQYREVRRPDATWVKDGPAARFTKGGKKLEQGCYKDGKRDGKWTFWNEGGSVDAARTGVYDNDVKVPTDSPVENRKHVPR